MGRRRGTRLAELVLISEERETLERWARRPSTAQGLALRCRIVLACAEGGANTEVAARLGISRTRSTSGAPGSSSIVSTGSMTSLARGRLGRSAMTTWNG